MKNLIVATALCMTSFLFAQKSANTNKGILTFETETINYGTIHQNENGNRTFTFKNTGTSPIVISRVKGSCGCTVATKPNHPIMPNETAQIGVKYDTKRVGAFSKTITITSNAVQKNRLLRIKGTVKKREATVAVVQ